MCDPSLPRQPCVDAGSMLFSMMSHSGPTYQCVCAKSLQPCLTLCDAMDCSPPDSSVHGNLQARILEWIAMPSSRGSSRPRDRTHIPYVSCPGREILYYYCHLGSLSLPVPSLHSNVGTHLLTSRVIPSSWLPSGLALTSVDWKGK